MLKYPSKLILPSLSVCTSVFFKLISLQNLQGFIFYFLNVTNYTQPIFSITIHKVMGLFTDSETRLNVSNFVYIGKISNVINMHELDKQLFPCV